MVLKTYNKIANWFDEHRSRELFEKPWLDKAISHLKPGASVLDCGCGMGEPIAAYFVEQGFNVTGVDNCEPLLAKARERLPSVNFINADMRTLNLKTPFDCVIAWHSFFHLNQTDQKAMFSTFATLTKPEGILLFTSGIEAREVWSDNGGEQLYHASLSTEDYQHLLKQHGFVLLKNTTQDESCGGATVWSAKRG